MEALYRFDCPSVSLGLNALLKGTRGALWAALVLAIVAHIGATQWRGVQEEERAAKPLTTQFVKRQPRLTKPLELKKRPRPKRRIMQRKMVSVKARVDRGQRTGTFRPAEVLQGLAHPSVSVGRATSFQDAELEPQEFAQMIEGQKEAQNVVDTSLEMLDIDALDTGRYWAIVVQDPRDKRVIKGFLHLASAYPVTAGRPNSEVRAWPDIIRPLVDAMNRFTDIRTDIQGRISFDSSDLLKLPFLYTRMWWVFRLSDSESNNLGRYLAQGGFLFAETVPPGGRFLPAYGGIKRMIEDALSTQGLEERDDWNLERLPNSHAVYHCYFDFDGSPMGTGWLTEYVDIDYLEGIVLDGRVVAILSQRNYALLWLEWERTYGKDPTRQLQFGVNLIIFALTQEGSITHQVMNRIY